MTEQPAPLIALPHRALIGLTGPDWGVFLGGQTTINAEAIFADVANGTHKPLYYGAFLTPQGKLSADFFLHIRGAEEVWIEVAADLRDDLFNRLNMFKLRAKVVLSKPEVKVFASIGAGDLPDPRQAGLFRHYGDDTATGDIADYIDFRLTAGLADPGFDFPKDYLYPIDINLDLIDAIDFKKGCFVGQETTSRMKRRGKIKNRLIPLTHTSTFAFGAEVLLGDKRAGEVLASRNGRSLALMRLDRLDGAPLTVDEEPVELSAPAWLRPHLVWTE
ncbi:folate-binding protein [Asticcacaulis sp. BYS171W]|uniref:Folate-binding protein n=1 Tax=Asticcacaulis aquaticus TaxID=2984212 RepID=A0ABT5HVD8_9CAUL|nr:folate-binding protein [Asticcacaulis aquaticus]MDC7683810.1 folate-binding protein [Asticcacaulis aquaticus]